MFTRGALYLLIHPDEAGFCTFGETDEYISFIVKDGKLNNKSHLSPPNFMKVSSNYTPWN